MLLTIIEARAHCSPMGRLLCLPVKPDYISTITLTISISTQLLVWNFREVGKFMPRKNLFSAEHRNSADS